MAINYSPTIVRDGLVMYLDAANVKSYPGTGTTWTDLSGNSNNGTLINGATFSASNNGVIEFDGVDDYADFQSPNTFLEYTFSFFAQWITQTASTSRIFGLRNYGTYTVLNPTNVGYHYNPLGGVPGSTTLSSNVNVGLGNWCHICVSESRTSSLAKIYINGTLRNSTSLISSQGFLGPFSLGAQYKLPPNGIHGNCKISNFSLYNRVFAAAEVQQNFEAMRGRFGI